MSKGINIFLLIGQSNMAGRGRVKDVPKLSTRKVLRFVRDAGSLRRNLCTRTSRTSPESAWG